ncbi:sodium:solute symporter family protein [Algoriphagus zhangzhouensis]|uniref:Solute:Na+ symporter, SSS family n=1 Tax=Algoriphagus zhangzhouensis TaxID=1073327 RepID=A0A1M7ZG37_9BACT|nr:sodium:solute symporter family protein [Algoriphagus zhangzhouensis]TDY44865.1 SSS family solute:Na+ symporter [Algoriphagus zhangzhouensis]SHO63843.1 solute:Na+ symporter, SSS family [Algoriphagus zhangzhouensis]
MTGWLIAFFGLFLLSLAYASYKSFQKNRTSDDFMLAGSNIGSILGFLTFSAALFSAFTFMGMPDFFRTHGVGAWIFLGLSDALMVFFIVWFGYKLRSRANEVGYQGVAGFVQKCYQNKYAGILLFVSSFLFLIPYVAIQIRGISIFLEAAFPGLLPFWAWASMLVGIMLIYSEIGGLKAIMYSDAIQGVILLVVIWIIGATCLSLAGGLETATQKIMETNPDLTILPGPKGLFTTPFLIASSIAIVMIPVTQPQFTTRLVVMKSLKSVHRMAYAVGLFAILVILPTAFIGLYGAIKYPDASTSDFLSGALMYDQAVPVAALAVVGLFAACLSTTNAQIFALGTELRSLLKGDDKRTMRITKVSIFLFSIIVLVFSTYMSDQLVLLARVSFAGTSMVAPVVLGAVVFKNPPKSLMILSSFALAYFILSLLSWVPNQIGGYPLDFVLYGIMIIATATIFITHSKKSQ